MIFTLPAYRMLPPRKQATLPWGTRVIGVGVPLPDFNTRHFKREKESPV